MTNRILPRNCAEIKEMGETVTENELYIIYPTSDPEVSLNSAYKHHLEASEPK